MLVIGMPSLMSSSKSQEMRGGISGRALDSGGYGFDLCQARRHQGRRIITFNSPTSAV